MSQEERDREIFEQYVKSYETNESAKEWAVSKGPEGRYTQPRVQIEWGHGKHVVQNTPKRGRRLWR